MNIETVLGNDFIDFDLFPVLPFENSDISVDTYAQHLYRRKKSRTIKIIDDSEIYE